MPFFSRDNLEFHYLDRGSGVPVFFQHGLGGETAKIFSLLTLPPGFRLLGMDCRAHGKTKPLGNLEKPRFDSMADDLVGLMDHLQIARAVFGGTSMGAGVALNCALRYPQRVLGLVLLRPAWLDGPNKANAKLFGFIAELIRDHGPPAASDIFKLSEPYLAIARDCPDSAASLLALFLDPRALETVDRLELIPQDAPNRDRSQWRGLAVRTLVMATRADPIHPFEYGQVLAQEIPGARFEELTPKSISLARYTSDLNRSLADFLLGVLALTGSSSRNSRSH
jgi:pimeloyl-ACP methyl ester carboxylesterase